MLKKVYIIGDWNARAQSFSWTAKKAHRDKVERITKLGYVNTATWHMVFHGEAKQSKVDFAEIDEADFIIALLDDQRYPTTKHWGALISMAFAIGRGKRSYAVISKSNALFEASAMHHELINCFETVEEFLKYLEPLSPTKGAVAAETRRAVKEIETLENRRKGDAKILKRQNNPFDSKLLHEVSNELNMLGYKTNVEIYHPNFPVLQPEEIVIFVWLRGSNASLGSVSSIL